MYFRDVIGLQDVKRHLIESVQSGFMPHARIFYGPEGVGKLPLAIAYARYLNCSNRGSMMPVASVPPVTSSTSWHTLTCTSSSPWSSRR